jgi:aldose sugar dehydrogenase
LESRYIFWRYVPADAIPESDLLSENSTYSHPDFAWNQTVGVAAIRFLDSEQLGDLLASDINNGNVYHFDLTNNNNNNNNTINGNRDSLLLDGQLSNKIANTTEESNEVLFATGFAGVTDLEVGPDGYLYILTFHKSQGSIYRIVPDT